MKTKPLAYAALAAVYVSLSAPAYAYLDAATGSMILQAVIGSVATAMVFGRTYLAKAKTFLTGGFSKKPQVSDVE